MPSINTIMLLGHLGADPETRVTARGKPVTELSVATNYRYQAADGEWKEETDWHKVVFFGPRAETARERMGKGDLVYVEGRLRQESWVAKDGSRRKTASVIGRSYRLLGRLQSRVGAQGDDEGMTGGPGGGVAHDPASEDTPF